MGAGAMEPLWGELGGIHVRCTFVAGDQDSVFIAMAQRMAQHVRDSRLRTVLDSGHSAHFEQPEATAGILTDHLRWAAAPAGTAGSSSTTD
jgi:pimeloyl-ACP methyl ester carboxylesterase